MESWKWQVTFRPSDEVEFLGAFFINGDRSAILLCQPGLGLSVADIGVQAGMTEFKSFIGGSCAKNLTNNT